MPVTERTDRVGPVLVQGVGGSEAEGPLREDPDVRLVPRLFLRTFGGGMGGIVMPAPPIGIV